MLPCVEELSKMNVFPHYMTTALWDPMLMFVVKLIQCFHDKININYRWFTSSHNMNIYRILKLTLDARSGDNRFCWGITKCHHITLFQVPLTGLLPLINTTSSITEPLLGSLLLHNLPATSLLQFSMLPAPF